MRTNKPMQQGCAASMHSADENHPMFGIHHRLARQYQSRHLIFARNRPDFERAIIELLGPIESSQIIIRRR
jgi:hypothetical protein